MINLHKIAARESIVNFNSVSCFCAVMRKPLAFINDTMLLQKDAHNSK